MAEDTPDLTQDAKQALLSLARRALQVWIQEKRYLTQAEIDEFAMSERLEQPTGAFVTLHNRGELRGCIGSIYADEPLCNTIAGMTVSAASRDPRFVSVRAAELADIDIEISALSPMAKVENIEEIQPGVHGLLLEHEEGRGLLLPQVATEYGWSREEFLQHTSRKAGLPLDGWKQATIYRFTATVFGEKES